MTNDYFQLLKDTETFWRAYPVRTCKLYMQRAYREAVEAGATHGEIMKGLEGYKSHVYREGTENKFIPAPHKWLEAGRWMDEYDRPATPEEIAEIKRKYPTPKERRYETQT